MRVLGVSIVCALAMILSGCGSSSSTPVNGNWSATVTNIDGSTAFLFSLTMNENSSTGAVSVTNLSFTSNSNSCFSTNSTGVGTFNTGGTTNGVTTGALQLTIQSGTSNTNGTNQLTLNGTLNQSSTSNTITGTWNLTGTGSDCTGNGNFTMGPAS
jgi:hypothetical protein